MPHPTAIPPLLGRPLAVRAERIDADAWFDQWSAAPAQVVHALGLAALSTGELRMLRSAVPFSHFNMVLTLGCPAPADAAAFAAIDAFYGARADTPHWILLNDFSQPGTLGEALQARGYRPDGAWDRVVLQGARHGPWAAHAAGCEPVTRANAAEWSRFILDCYGMPPVIGDWLAALVGRPGWIHALRRAGGRADGPIAMVRSLFHDASGWAWLGIDAPVPGVMAACFEDDQKLVATLVQAAAGHGVHSVVSDIEQPHPGRDGEAYRRWGELGFEPVYTRSLFARAVHPGAQRVLHPATGDAP